MRPARPRRRFVTPHGASIAHESGPAGCSLHPAGPEHSGLQWRTPCLRSILAARPVAYYRMSTDAQEGSIPAQKDWARKAAPKEGVRVIAEFEDPGIAGGEIEHRPGLQALLEFCEQRFRRGEAVEAVLVWDPD